jgi:hypothetical protein
MAKVLESRPSAAIIRARIAIDIDEHDERGSKRSGAAWLAATSRHFAAHRSMKSRGRLA